MRELKLTARAWVWSTRDKALKDSTDFRRMETAAGKARAVRHLFVAAALYLLPSSASALEMHIAGNAHPPQAYLAFCARQPEDCSSRQTEPAVKGRELGHWPSGGQRNATNWALAFREAGSARAPSASSDSLMENSDERPQPLRWSRSIERVLSSINQHINWKITSRRDEDLYGVSDFWMTPLEAGGSSGDCEDFVLQKRRALIEAGLPSSTLSIAIVKTSRGEPHAVLLVNTTRGEYVLDNRSNRILLWWLAPYTWEQRQISGRAYHWAQVAHPTWRDMR